MAVTYYGRLGRDKNAWVMQDIPPHVAIKLKAMFPGIAKAQTNDFKFPDTPGMCTDLEWFLHRYPMEMSEGDRRALSGQRELFHANRADIEKIFTPEWTAPARYGFKPGSALRPSQEQAASMTQKLGRLLLADAVGEGKTWVAMGTMVGSPHLPAAVVASTHLPSQWVNEYLKPHTYLRPHIIRGTKPYRLPDANVFLFRYSNIAGWSDIAAQGIFRTFICDEVQNLRTGPGTDKYDSAAVFASHAAIRLFMSATPIFNYGDEIFHIMNLLEPGCLGERSDFIREWCTSGPGGKFIVKDPIALGTYLREQQLILRRQGKGHPVNTMVIEVDADEDVERESYELAQTLATRVVSGSFMESGQAARELDALARMTTGLAKAKSVAAYVRILLKSGHPVLLGGWHREVYKVWLEELREFRPVMFTGTETPRQKERAKADFIEGRSDLMIMSLRSGEGTDGLQRRCSVVVHGELDWSGKVHEQFTGRVAREGQKAPEIQSIFLVTNTGSDPTIQNVIGLKNSQFRGIMDPTLGVEVVHSDMSRIKELAKAYLKQMGAA